MQNLLLLSNTRTLDISCMSNQVHAESVRDRILAEVRRRALLERFVAEELQLQRAADAVLEASLREIEEKRRPFRWSEWVI